MLRNLLHFAVNGGQEAETQKLIYSRAQMNIQNVTETI